MIHILERYNQHLEHHISNNLPYLIFREWGWFEVVFHGKTYKYSYIEHGEEFFEATPTPILLNNSSEEFVLMKYFEHHRDQQHFYNLHEFATLIGTITALNGDIYMTCALPAKVLNVDGMMKEHLITDHRSSIRSLIEINPEFETHPNILKRRARVKMLNDINPTESLADLEKQVDFLTKIISELVTDTDTKAKLESILENSAYSYKDEADIIKDVVNSKAQLRDAMKPYLEVKRNAIQNSV